MRTLKMRDLKVRADMQDFVLLLAWRNDALTRQMSLTQDTVPLEAHLDWLSRKLRDETVELLIGEIEGIPVGHVRIDRGVVTYVVAPEYRGQGFGRRLIEAIMDRGPLTALVKPENVPSCRVFESLGWRKTVGELNTYAL